jgi:hypothetical protein
METINIDFEGFIEVDKLDLPLMMSDGTPIDRSNRVKMSADQIVEGLQNGTYMLDFMGAYVNAITGEEKYEFSVNIE